MVLMGFPVALRAGCVLLSLLLAGCVSTRPSADEDEVAAPPPAGIRFLLWGDTGTGEADQYRVAEAALDLCSRKGCDFALNNGDNIYNNGVDSVTDPQFESKFERPYANFTIPFYLVLGNHDNGDGTGSDSTAGDFQVAYHHRTDPPRMSDKWNMPARYYPIHKTNGNTSASFFGLDTNTLNLFGDPLNERDLFGAAQQAWLEDEIAASASTWKFTWGHHPYISNGQHGNAGTSDGIPGQGQTIKTFYEEAACGKVDIIFAGHDHDLQWLEPVAACGSTEFIVSGAGAQVRPLGGGTNPAFFELGATLGFYWIEIVGNRLVGEVYDVDGNLLFSRTLEK